ncbi:MAG: hypothetical protein ACOYMG_05935 [Candidatus Methylumidiphilus sp.]
MLAVLVRHQVWGSARRALLLRASDRLKAQQMKELLLGSPLVRLSALAQLGQPHLATLLA